MIKQIAVLLVFSISVCQANAHGSHGARDGLTLHVDRVTGAVEFDTTSRNRIKERVSSSAKLKHSTTSDLRRVDLVRGLGSGTKDRKHSANFSNGQIFATVKDPYFGTYSILLQKIRAYASHDGFPGHHATPVGDRIYYNLPNRVVSGADWIEIRRATDSGDVLLKKLEFSLD